MIDANTAEDQGWALGDPIRVLTKAGPTELTVVGTATYGELGGVPGSSLVATDDATAQRLFAEPGRYDSVLVAGAAGVTSAELAARIEASVAPPGSGLEALTGEQDTADKQADFQDDLAFFDQFLMAFAYVALFVGTFIIYNTFSIVVAQRMRGPGHAAGHRRPPRPGAALGGARVGRRRRGRRRRSVWPPAIGLSFGLRALLAAGGLDIPSGSLVVSSATDHDGARRRRDRQRAVGARAGRAGQPGPADRRAARRGRRPVRRRRSGGLAVGLLLTGAGVAVVRRGPVGVRPGRPAADRSRRDDDRPRRVHARPGAGRAGHRAARRADAGCSVSPAATPGRTPAATPSAPPPPRRR